MREPMTLSDAIRLGAMLKPQGFGDYYDDAGGSCALGAAADACGVNVYAMADFEATFALVFKTRCPACWQRPDVEPSFGSGFINTVLHLNDDHRWTREAIADWVQTIEPPLSALSIEAPPTRSVAVDPSADVLERDTTRGSNVVNLDQGAAVPAR